MNSVASPRYLTKTRFKIAVECPTKLYYTGKPTVYADAKQEDDFPDGHPNSPTCGHLKFPHPERGVTMG